MASSVGLNADPIGYEVDTLLRNDGNTAAGKSASVGNSVTVETSRRDASHVLAMGAAHGSLSSDDRIYVARAIAAHAVFRRPTPKSGSTRFSYR